MGFLHILGLGKRGQNKILYRQGFGNLLLDEHLAYSRATGCCCFGYKPCFYLASLRLCFDLHGVAFSFVVYFFSIPISLHSPLFPPLPPTSLPAFTRQHRNPPYKQQSDLLSLGFCLFLLLFFLFSSFFPTIPHYRIPPLGKAYSESRHFASLVFRLFVHCICFLIPIYPPRSIIIFITVLTRLHTFARINQIVYFELPPSRLRSAIFIRYFLFLFLPPSLI